VRQQVKTIRYRILEKNFQGAQQAVTIKRQGQTYYLTTLLTSPFIDLETKHLYGHSPGQLTGIPRPGGDERCPERPDYPKSLLRRIKRRVIAREHTFFAVTNPGLEDLCLEQIRSLLRPPARAEKVSGGIEFRGRLTDCYLVNLHCRFAVRVLMRIITFRATSFAALEKSLARVPWEL